MTPQQAILDHANGKLSRLEMFRALFAFADWYAGTTPTHVWLAVGADGGAKAAATYGGTSTKVDRLDDFVLGLSTEMLRIEPGPVSRILDATDIYMLQTFAGGARTERALVEHDLRRVRMFDGYVLPYFGEPEKPEYIGLTVPGGVGLVAFTNDDTIHAFLAAQDEKTRAEIKVTLVDGTALFTRVAKKGNGILLNNNGPIQPVFLDGETCAKLAAI